MGAAPSREVATHSLPRAPFYGQRQQIVLIPLLKDFFPSADCALFRQLYDARCDPAVRYYHYAQEKCAGKDGGDDPNEETSAERGGHAAVGVACSPAGVFPATPCTPEEMYRTYIEEGGERLVYETDADMLAAYQTDPHVVRPLPCAVAFFYPPPEGTTVATAKKAEERGEGDHTAALQAEGENDKERAALESASTEVCETIRMNQLRIFGQGTEPGMGVEGCVSVLGCYVKATGFVGDISRLLGSLAKKRQCSTATSGSTDDALDPADGYELDLYLTKSAGDHNRTHVLLSAIYTYAEQWQRACLRYSAQQDAKDAGGASSSTERASGAYEATRIFAASTSAYYKQFVQTLTPPALLQSLFPPGNTDRRRGSGDAASLKAHEGEEEGGLAGEPSAGETGGGQLEWAPPPLAAVRMRGRRTNVPLLCFLREIRTIFLGIHAAATPWRSEGESAEAVMSGQARDHAIRVGALRDLVLWLEDVLPSHGGSSGARNEALLDTLLNIYAPRSVVQTLVGHTMSCLLHNVNPQEVPRVLEQNGIPGRPPPSPQQQHQHRADAHADAKGEEGGEVDPEEGESREGQGSFSAAGAIAHAAAKPLSLRLPDEDCIVEPWAATQAAVAVAVAVAPADRKEEVDASPVDLTLLTVILPEKHLYWVIGPSVEERASATTSLVEWHRRGHTVLVSYDTDEAHPPCKVGNSMEDLMQVLQSLRLRSDEGGTQEHESSKEEVLLDAGLALELRPVDPSSSGARALRVCRLPLEEALLGELSDACKQARQAGPSDAHWVRSETQRAVSEAEQQQQQRQPENEGKAEHAPGLVAENADVALRPPEAMDIVGDGSSCLYRVVLPSSAARIIAVTPFFLKVQRKKLKKKSTAKTRSGTCGTAANVFYAAPEPAPAKAPPAAAGPADKKCERAKDDGAATKECTGKEEDAAVAEEAEERGQASETASADLPNLSKAQKKKAKKRAAAAATATAGATAAIPVVAAEASEACSSDTLSKTDVPVAEGKQSSSTRLQQQPLAEAAKEKDTARQVSQREQGPLDHPKACHPAPSPIDANLDEYQTPTFFVTPQSMSRQPQTAPVSSSRSSLSPSAQPFVAAGTTATVTAAVAAAYNHNYGSSGGSNNIVGYTTPPSSLPQAYGGGYAYPQQAQLQHQQQQPHPYGGGPYDVAPPPPPLAPVTAATAGPSFHPQQHPYQHPMATWLPTGNSTPYTGVSQPAPLSYYNPAPGSDANSYAPPPPPPPPSSSYPLPMTGLLGQPASMTMFTANAHSNDPRSQAPHRPPPVPRSVANAAAAAAAAASKEGTGRTQEAPPSGAVCTGEQQQQQHQAQDGVPAIIRGDCSRTDATATSTTTTTGSAAVIRRHVSFDVDALPSPREPSMATTLPPPQTPGGGSDSSLQMLSFPPPLPRPLSDEHQTHMRVTSSVNWEPSSTSQLIFHPEDMSSPMTADSANFPPPKHSLEASLTAFNNDGASSGSALRVTVVRRHHQHPRTSSYISDATTNDGGNASQTGGGGGGGGAVLMARSFTSGGSGSQLHPTGTHNPYAAQVTGSATATANASSSKAPVSPTSPSGKHPTLPVNPSTSNSQQQSQQQLPPAGAASSTRSGDTGASGARRQTKGGRYRWDWRSVNIDYADEE